MRGSSSTRCFSLQGAQGAPRSSPERDHLSDAAISFILSTPNHCAVVTNWAAPSAPLKNHANTPIYFERVKHFAAFSYPDISIPDGSLAVESWWIGSTTQMLLLKKAPISDHIESSRMLPRGSALAKMRPSADNAMSFGN